MITTYQLELSARLMPSDGYKLYAWLLAQIPSDVAEALHSQQDHPISQFVTFDKETDTSIYLCRIFAFFGKHAYHRSLFRCRNLT